MMNYDNGYGTYMFIHPIAFLRPDQALCCAASGASKAFWRFYRRLTRQVSSTFAAGALVLLTSQAGGSKAYQKIPLSHSANHFSTSQSGTTEEGQRLSHSRVHSLWTSTLHNQCYWMIGSGVCSSQAVAQNSTAASATIGIQHLNLHLRIQLLISSWVEHLLYTGKVREAFNEQIALQISLSSCLAEHRAASPACLFGYVLAISACMAAQTKQCYHYKVSCHRHCADCAAVSM